LLKPHDEQKAGKNPAFCKKYFEKEKNAIFLIN